MKRGFATIMAAQFFSSLADNALFVAAVELLRSQRAAAWQAAALVPMFALFYVLLAPWVGAFADSRPKGQVMFISNAIKIAGCLLMLAGAHPLLAYGLVGLGAAAYSPAKYGILTELLAPEQLVKANGWMEGLTIASIILGVVLGGQLLRPEVFAALHALPGVHGAADAAVLVLALVYGVAAAFNVRIPCTGAPLHAMHWSAQAQLPDFYRCTRLLWRDRLGQISLATTTLFWGVSGNMRYIVLAWAAAALHYDTTRAANLVGVVALGTAAGAALASRHVRLERATRVMPLGVAMGVLLMGMVLVRNVWLALPLLLALGALGGCVVVPMNALLQHRGQCLMGAGRSIAVQNFNEQACILLLGALYSAAAGGGLSAFAATALMGAAVAGCMLAISAWHRYNLRFHRAELRRLLRLARRGRRR